eukprot:gene101-510_t
MVVDANLVTQGGNFQMTNKFDVVTDKDEKLKDKKVDTAKILKALIALEKE